MNWILKGCFIYLQIKSDIFTIMRIDEDNKNIISILNKYVSKKLCAKQIRLDNLSQL